MIKRIVIFFVFSISLYSQENNVIKENEDRKHYNDKGFYFNLSAGEGGFINGTKSANSILYFDLLIGLTVKSNLSLFTGIVMALNPNFLIPITPVPFESPAYQFKASNDVRLKSARMDGQIFGGFPLGFSYYFEEKKIFLSFYFADSNLNLPDIILGKHDEFSILLKTSIQKELFINKKWGIGISFNIGYGLNNLGKSYISQGVIFGIGLTITFE